MLISRPISLLYMDGSRGKVPLNLMRPKNYKQPCCPCTKISSHRPGGSQALRLLLLNGNLYIGHFRHKGATKPKKGVCQWKLRNLPGYFVDEVLTGTQRASSVWTWKALTWPTSGTLGLNITVYLHQHLGRSLDLTG